MFPIILTAADTVPKLHYTQFYVTSGSEGDNTTAISPAIVGGLLGTLLILSVMVFISIATWLLKNHRGNDTCTKYAFCCILYSSCMVLKMFLIKKLNVFSISCILMLMNIAITIYHTCSRPAGSTMDIPASANVAYELSKLSSQLKEALYE